MDKTTIIILIIIMLICCVLLIVTGYISFKVYTKPEQPPIITSSPVVVNSNIPPQIQQPTISPVVPEYIITPEVLSAPASESIISETNPVVFNQPIKVTPEFAPKRTMTVTPLGKYAHTLDSEYIQISRDMNKQVKRK